MAAYEAIVFWLAIGVATAPIWGPALWILWQGVVRPHLVPRREIERMATLLIEREGDRAEDVAFGEEYGAWRNSDSFAQGRWRRVRRLIGIRQVVPEKDADK